MIRAEDHASLAAGSLPSATGCFASGLRIRIPEGGTVAAPPDAPYRRPVRGNETARRKARAKRDGRRIVVVGGGLGGLAAAILLGRAGHRVTVLERDVRPEAATPDEAFAT